MTREKAIKSLQFVRNALTDDMEIAKAYDMAIESLKQEPKTGHWILDETDNSITCDKCGCLLWANDISDGEAHYCPNCGAKMVEPQEGEDT